MTVRRYISRHDVILGLVPRIYWAIARASKWILGMKPSMTFVEDSRTELALPLHGRA